MQGFTTTPNVLIIFIIFKLIQHLENESRNSKWGKRRRAVVLPLCPLLTLELGQTTTGLILLSLGAK